MASEMYFRGGEGIINPVDCEGTEIAEGDILTHSWFEGDYVEFFKTHLNISNVDEIEQRVHQPSVFVKYNEKEKFYYGEGISKKLYMHDFRFKYAKKIKII